MIGLDAAFPPNPDQWVADLRSVGAQVGFYYAWGPFVRYTPAHLQAAKQAGIQTMAIIVPGNVPGPVQPMLAVVSALGGSGDPIALDLESGSLPPPQWVLAAISAIRAAGHRAYRYGDQSVLQGYPTADADWVSHLPGTYIRKGFYQPIPRVPSGYWAWQYAVDVPINNSMYDVSVVDSLIGTEQEETDMFIFFAPNGTGYLVYSNGMVQGFPDDPDRQQVQAALGGRNAGTLTQGMTDDFLANDKAVRAALATQPAGSAPADLTALTAAVEALAKHLGVGTA